MSESKYKVLQLDLTFDLKNPNYMGCEGCGRALGATHLDWCTSLWIHDVPH